MHECADEEDCKEKAKKIDEVNKEYIITFAEHLIEALKGKKTEREIEFEKWLGVEFTKKLQLYTDYPLYQQTQACFAWNKFCEKYTKVKKIIGYSDGKRSSAEYQEVELKPKKFESLVIRGDIFFTWKNTNFVAHIFYKNQYAETTIHFAKGKKKVAKEFLEEIREFMRDNNFLKGEVLEFNKHGFIEWLNYPKIGWDELILSNDIKDEILLNIIFPIKNEQLCKKHKIPWRRGVLLAGVAGTGKTQLARVLCNVLQDVTIIWVSSKAINEPSTIQTLYECARFLSPTLVVLEDIDFFGHDREFITNPIVGELLTQLDGNAPNDGIFTLATTNRPHLLDKALLDRPSRFDVKILFDLPKPEQRRQLAELFSKGKSFAPEVTIDVLAQIAEGFTGAHLKEMIVYATLLSLREGKPYITEEHIKRANTRLREKMTKQPKGMSS